MTRQTWSIGLTKAASPLDLRTNVSAAPIVTAADITDADAGFVADPFLIFYRNIWYLFFEVWNRAADKGEIGVAESPDMVRWVYRGIVLREPWHLSYPHVFEHDGTIWMMPESIEGGGVRLYRAEAFPLRWRYHGELMAGAMADPTPFLWCGAWYIFGCPRFNSHDALVLYTSPRLEDGWRPHPASPIYTSDARRARPAGRMIVYEGRPLRWAQDCVPRYGTAVRAFEIQTLSPTHYLEHEWAESPVLSRGERTWNRDGMHHVDAHRLGGCHQGSWVAAVDGWHGAPDDVS
jgi:hypothetical protein